MNQEVVNGFVKLVDKLVNDPSENKVVREEISQNLCLMIQECNKYRDHQGRELLIKTLEEQLEKRNNILRDVNNEIRNAENLLGKIYQ